MSIDAKVHTRLYSGTGSLYLQIAPRFFIMISCAHNFVQFEQVAGKPGKSPIYATNNGTNFYLQRDGDDFKCEMRVIDFIIHQDYLKDGNSSKPFQKGTDIALCVVEIPEEKYT